MSALEITLMITLYANALATQLTVDETNLYAAIFSQFGDTLATIATQRGLQEEQQETNKDNHVI